MRRSLAAERDRKAGDRESRARGDAANPAAQSRNQRLRSCRSATTERQLHDGDGRPRDGARDGQRLEGRASRDRTV